MSVAYISAKYIMEILTIVSWNLIFDAIVDLLRYIMWNHNLLFHSRHIVYGLLLRHQTNEMQNIYFVLKFWNANIKVEPNVTIPAFDNIKQRKHYFLILHQDQGSWCSPMSSLSCAFSWKMHVRVISLRSPSSRMVKTALSFRPAMLCVWCVIISQRTQTMWHSMCKFDNHLSSSNIYGSFFCNLQHYTCQLKINYFMLQFKDWILVSVCCALLVLWHIDHPICHDWCVCIYLSVFLNCMYCVALVML